MSIDPLDRAARKALIGKHFPSAEDALRGLVADGYTLAVGVGLCGIQEARSTRFGSGAK